MSNLDNILLLKFIDFVYKNSGIRFDDSNKVVLQGRIIDTLRKLNLDSPEYLFELISRDSLKKKYFLDIITTNLTSFFRDILHFETFEKFVIPSMIEIKRQNNNRKIVLWSTGCSTGEEPYSLAMVLEDKLPSNFSFVIIASDLSLKSLLVAKEGVYSKIKCNAIPAKYLEKYMEPCSEGYKVSSKLRKHIRFDYHNLKFDSGFRNIDIVFCRNVLIYFDEKSRIDTLKRFYTNMSSRSYLFIGSSESLFGLGLDFKFLKTQWTIIYEKDG